MLKVELKDDNVQSFSTRWDETMIAMKKPPDEDLFCSGCVVWRTGMFDDQHDCQASVGSNIFKQARMRVALSATAGILSALAPLLIKETVFFLSEYRQASERQELAHKFTGALPVPPQ